MAGTGLGPTAQLPPSSVLILSVRSVCMTHDLDSHIVTRKSCNLAPHRQPDVPLALLRGCWCCAAAMLSAAVPSLRGSGSAPQKNIAHEPVPPTRVGTRLQ